MFPNEFEIFPTNPLPLPNNLPAFIPNNHIFDVGNSLNRNSQQQLLSSAENPRRTISLINNLIKVDNDENLINNITNPLKDLDINLENLSTNNLLTTDIQLAVKDFLTGSVSTEITLEEIALSIDADIDINSAAGLAELFDILELLNIDVKPPEITAELANDTGADNTDNITSDPTIIGTVTDNSEIASLTVGLNETPTENFVDITAEISESGNFELDQEFLENLFGKPLINDTYTLKFQATDEHGLESEILEIEFTLEAEAPEISAELTNDTGADNTDKITSDPTIIGKVTDESEIASLTVGLNETPTEDFVDITAEITETGKFELDQESLEEILGEPLQDGINLLKLQATDEHNNLSEIVEIEFTLDTEAPEIFVELANDTGTSDTDKLTADPTIIANVLDGSEVVSLKAGFNNNSTEDFWDLTAELEIDGSLELTPELLAEMLGDILVDGTYTLYLQAIDEHDIYSDIIEFEFTFLEAEIDRPGPEILSLAEIYGLDTYPDAIALTPTSARQLSVKIDGWVDSPELTTDIEDITYTIADGDIVEISDEGLITATGVGETTITFEYGEASATIPVLVDEPETGAAIIDENGGIVEGSDGALVMVAPGALTEETLVNLTPLEQQDLSMPIPESLEFVGAFELELGETPLNEPAQIAIPAPADLEQGSGVLFLRKGQMPDASGTWRDTWLIEEIGVAGSDRMIRTTSFPYPGLTHSGEYLMLQVPPELLQWNGGINAIIPFKNPPYVTPTQQNVSDYTAWLDEIRDLIKVTGAVSRYQYLGARAGLIGLIGTSYAQFLLTSVLAAYVATLDDSSLDIIGIPQVGPPVGTSTNVLINSDGLPTYSVEIDAPTLTTADPLLAPVLQSAELQFENDKPYVLLRGSNFLHDFEDEVGNDFEDLSVKFYVGDEIYEIPVLPNISRELDDNQFEIGVEIPLAVPLGEAEITLSRKQEKRIGVGINNVELVELESSEQLQLSPASVELALVSQKTADTVSVIDVLDARSVVEGTNSADLLRAKISVGTPDVLDIPGELAATSNATRAYVPLEGSGKVAVVDLMTLRQVDGKPETSEVEPLALPDGATPVALTIDKRDEYAYVADMNGGKVYVLDINPESDSYHQVVETIELELNNNDAKLRQVAISADGRRLFITASDSQVYVINIDPNDRPLDGEPNSRKWWEQIGAVATAEGAMGLSATNNPLKMTFTSGNTEFDGRGFGVLNITNDDPLAFEATTNYAKLSLDFATDYFDVDEGVAVTIMKDGSYAFVAGQDTRGNAGTSFFPDKREGGNIGIIKDPLGDNPQLVAATRPIPGSLTNNVVLSFDDKYLMASYPTLDLDGAVYVFDVEEIIETIETLELKANGEDSDELEVYWLDSRNRGEGSVAFEEGSKRSATFGDLVKVPIDDINPEISVAADYEIIGGNWVNQFTYGVPEDTQRSPIGIGGNPMGLTSVSVRDVVELLPITETVENDSLKRTLNWNFKIKGEGDGNEDESNKLIAIDPQNVTEMNLYVSVFKRGEGLLPSDEWDELKEQPGLENLEDYNPNRVLTATAKWNPTKQKWIWKSGDFESEVSSLPQEFTLPDELRLTGGQTYHWAVEVVQNGIENVKTGEFKTPLAATGSSNTFSNVTILSRGIEAHPTQIDKQFQNLANSITTTGNGLVLQYDFSEGKWYQDTRGGKNYTIPDDIYGKPLVLVPGLDSREKNVPELLKNGFAEAAGDRLFASLVQLDQSLGGSVGEGKNTYDATGKLIRKPGAIFKSPLHFVGFGQGATVNNEAIQRLGTFFPNAYDGSSSGKTPDLQMTTIDAPDQTQPLTKKLYDPEIKIWENVTFADNYYQKATFSPNKIFSGQNLADADLNVFLGEPSNSESRTGFTVDTEISSHHRALGWYAGTANLSQQTFPSVVKDKEEEYTETEEVTYRRLGDLELDASGQPKTPTWYTPDYKDYPLEHGDENAPWEGIGTGWFYSVNGGGKDVRHPQLSSQRSPVSYDNTNINHPDRGEKVRGDYTVPTLFNGNFEAVIPSKDGISRPIPGWAFNNSIKQNSVKLYKKENAVLQLQKDEKITHNPFIVPEYGDLRFDIWVSKDSLSESNNNRLKVSLNPMNSKDGKGVDQIVFLTRAKGTLGAYEDDRYKIATNGKFETFHIDIPKELRGKPATLSFGLESLSGSNISVLLDDVFFGSELLKLANPTEARPDSKSGQYNNNYLIEKPQYILSYNNQKHTPNWVSWEVNESWLSEEEFKRPGFIPDPELNETGWYQVKDGDYGENDRTKLPDGKYLAAGHMTAAEDRTKSKKDFIATFVTTNILPQHPQNNGGPWKSLEGHLRSRAKLGSDFTVFAGGAGTLADFPSIEVGDKKNTEIQVPSHIWKVVIARNLGDPIDLGRDAYAVIMPNENIAGQEWTEYRYSIQQLQDWLALDPKSPKYLDFLSGIKDDAQRNKLIKANKNSSPPPALT